MALRNGGIIDKTKDAVKAYEDAADDEQHQLEKFGEVIDSKIPLLPNINDIENIEDIDDSIGLPAKRSEDELIGLGYIPIYTVVGSLNSGGLVGSIQNYSYELNNVIIEKIREKDYLAARKRTDGGTDKDYTEINCSVDSQSSLNSL